MAQLPTSPAHFIDGVWLAPVDGGTREIRCPADGSLVATVAEGAAADSVAAIRAARAAFDDGAWSGSPARERGDLLARLADRLTQQKEEVARLEALDTGKRMVEARLDMDDIIGVFRHFAALANADAGRVVDTGMPGVSSRIVYEPVGVCSLITPWNYPLLQRAGRSRRPSRRAARSCSSPAS